jgi:hypothetical protein
MSLGNAQRMPRSRKSYLALATRVLIAIELCFWLYTIYFIQHHADLNGSGLEVLAMIPMAVIALFVVFPALALTFLERSHWSALGLAILAAAGDAALWGPIVVAIRGATSSA